MKNIFKGIWNFLKEDFVLKIGGIMVILIAITVLLIEQSPEEKLQEVILEYNQMRDEITMRAESRISIEKSEVEKLNDSISLIESRIKVYAKCIAENKSNANSITPPIDCSEIDLSKQEELGWKLNRDGLAQDYVELSGETYSDRAEELLELYDKTKGTWDIWERFGKEYNIDPVLAIAIAKADSSLGNELKSMNNIGNVGNNDRGDVVDYNSIEDGIRAIYKTLNNQYLGKIYTVGYLSCGGKRNIGITNCFQNGEKVYATSEDNWNVNVLNTMSMIYGKEITEDYKFRL